MRIVLTEPFIKHPAGLVFELNEATGVSGWDDDERVRERMNYSNKQTCYLPDGGNGRPYDLLVSSTKSCPPEVFENEDLRSGPCRLTRAAFEGQENQNDVWNAGFNLIEINGLQAQGFDFPVAGFETLPSGIHLHDVLNDKVIRPLVIDCRVNCSDLLPGFYELRLTFLHGDPYSIRFIKSFPLLVLFTDRSGRYTVQKTLY